ncbi:hypothetical protein ACP70R_037180 [Stipagrostis hirtigluma subsp. patula]
MASPSPAAAGDQLAIQMPAAAPGDPSPAGDVLQGKESAASKPEKSLNRFVRIVAFGEWTGNAFGALAFLWATVVLLGGFCSSLKRQDFWFSTIMIFLEAFSPTMKYRTVHLWSVTIGGILKVALLILMSKLELRGAPQLTCRQQRHRRLLLWAFMIASVLLTAYDFSILVGREYIIDVPGSDIPYFYTLLSTLPYMSSSTLTEVMAVLLLNLRPRRIASLTSSRRGRMLLSLAKVISASWQAIVLALNMWPLSDPPTKFDLLTSLITPFQLTILVLSLGSLQTPANGLLGHCIDVIMHIFFLLNSVFPFPPLAYLVLVNVSPFTLAMSFIILLAALLIGNLQIPASVAQVVLSSLRLRRLLASHDYYPLPQGSSPNLVPSIAVFYVLAVCQGALCIMACVLGLFSFFPRRSLIHRSKFSGKHGVNAIDLYYERAYATRMEIGVFTGGDKISFGNFAIESLSSSSGELQIAGACVLDNILRGRDYSRELITRVTNSSETVSTLIGMLGWTDVEDCDIIRLFAARATAELASNLSIDGFPGMVKLVSLLLDAENVVIDEPSDQESSAQTASGNGGNAGSQPTDDQSAQGNNVGCSWVYRFWQRTKEKWSIPKEPPLTPHDSFPVLGMVILERLACDPDNCAEIVKGTNLISKLIGFISYTNNNERRSNVTQQNEVICSALKFVRHLAITGETTLRQELWKNPFLLNNLTCILDDSRSNRQLWEPAMHIIAKLALDEDARQEIGTIQLIIGKLMHAFIGKDGENSTVIKDLKYLLLVLENIMSAEGKHLEVLVGLASHLCYVIPEYFIHELGIHTNRAGLVKKLVDTLNSNRKPSPEYPRMRRVVVCMTIFTAKWCHGYANMFKEKGMMEALSMVQKWPSKVETYRVFLGNKGVVLERGLPLRDLAARAKEEIDSATSGRPCMISHR